MMKPYIKDGKCTALNFILEHIIERMLFHKSIDSNITRVFAMEYEFLYGNQNGALSLCWPYITKSFLRVFLEK